MTSTVCVSNMNMYVYIYIIHILSHIRKVANSKLHITLEMSLHVLKLIEKNTCTHI